MTVPYLYNQQHVDYSYFQTQAIRDEEYDFEKLAQRIWEYQWSITTRVKWAYDKKMYEEVGVYTYGNAILDEERLNQWTNTTRSIAELAEWYNDGKEFILRSNDSAETIFKAIGEYTEFVAYMFNTKIHLTYVNLEKNEKAREVLEDVIKLQNLANHLFPVMIQFAPEEEPEQAGLFGWLSQHQDYGQKLQFDPYLKYGFNREAVVKEENKDKLTGKFKAIDMEREFNPGTLQSLRRVI